MTRHFDRQIHRLKRMILELGSLVETALECAIRSIEERDAAVAQGVIDRDREIDLKEVEIGEECLHTLALYQPVASDLRYIGSVLTINKDLERIGDLAVNMAEQAIPLADQPPLVEVPFDLSAESQRVFQMLKHSLDALIHFDPELAETVIIADDEVDEIHREVCKNVEDEIRRNPEDVRRMIEVLTISRQLERIADHAVNIAEDVVYMVRGEIYRHNYARDPV
jgi:phosphate transport system protein